MKGWVEIFRAGTHTPSKGEPVTVTAQQVEAIAGNYDPSQLEAPIVIGHPTENAPAYGWVEKLKAEGGKLFAQFKQVHEGFRDAVQAGRFKNRSVSLYKDLDGHGLSLRHVGFLGAAAPAVRGLKPIEFHEGDFHAFDFNEGGTEAMTIEELKKALEEGLANFTEKLKATLNLSAAPEKGVVDVEARIAEAVQAATADLSTQFSAQVEGLKTQLGESHEAAAKAQRTAAAGDLSNFREKLRAEGHWVPAFDQMGAYEFMQALGSGGDTVEFSQGEGDDKKTVKQAPLEFFQGFLGGLPKIVEFKELTPDGQKAAASNLVQFNEPKAGQTVLGLDVAEEAKALAVQAKISFAEALGRVKQQRAG